MRIAHNGAAAVPPLRFRTGACLRFSGKQSKKLSRCPAQDQVQRMGVRHLLLQIRVDGAHEKGGSRGEGGGGFQRTHCVPMPQVDSIAELKKLFAAADAKDAHLRLGNRPQTVGDDGEVERASLRPLPADPFPTWLTLSPRFDRSARVTVRQPLYSVPVPLIGRTVRVQLGASTVTIFDGRRRS